MKYLGSAFASVGDGNRTLCQYVSNLNIYKIHFVKSFTLVVLPARLQIL